jgi:hypothetical protein
MLCFGGKPGLDWKRVSGMSMKILDCSITSCFIKQKVCCCAAEKAVDGGAGAA